MPSIPTSHNRSQYWWEAFEKYALLVSHPSLHIALADWFGSIEWHVIRDCWFIFRFVSLWILVYTLWFWLKCQSSVIEAATCGSVAILQTFLSTIATFATSWNWVDMATQMSIYLKSCWCDCQTNSTQSIEIKVMLSFLIRSLLNPHVCYIFVLVL